MVFKGCPVNLRCKFILIIVQVSHFSLACRTLASCSGGSGLIFNGGLHNCGTEVQPSSRTVASLCLLECRHGRVLIGPRGGLPSARLGISELSSSHRVLPQRAVGCALDAFALGESTGQSHHSAESGRGRPGRGVLLEVDAGVFRFPAGFIVL